MESQFAQGLTVSADNSPTQNTPNTAPQEPQKASAGPALPCDGALNCTLSMGFLQEGHTGFAVEFMGTEFLSSSIEF